MNPNATLIGQMITFALFVWFTMKYVWPPIMNALNEREKKIAAGLAAAERGVHELELAKERSLQYLHDAKEDAAKILEQANKRAAQLMSEAKIAAREEGQRLITSAKAEIDHQVIAAKQILRQQMASLLVLGTEKILERNIDLAANEVFIAELVRDIYPLGVDESSSVSS